MKVLWLRDGKAGHENKARGLLGAIGKSTEIEVTEHRLDWRFPWLRNVLPRLGGAGLLLPVGLFLKGFPDKDSFDLILSAGGTTQWPNAAFARQTQASNVFLGSLRKMEAGSFSLVASHDAPEGDPAFHRFDLIPSMVTPADARQAAESAGLLGTDRWGLLVGGDGEGVRWDEKDMRMLAEKFIGCARTAGVTAWIATSRRTPTDLEVMLRSLIEESGICGGECWFHKRSAGAPGLLAMMGASSKLFVTADSMSMTHEAVASGCPVYVIAPQGMGNRRLKGNLDGLGRRGYIVRQDLHDPFDVSKSPEGGWKMVDENPYLSLSNAVIACMENHKKS